MQENEIKKIISDYNIKEIPGFNINSKKINWKIYFRKFDLNIREDVKEINKIYTKAASSIFGQHESGLAIFQESEKFLEDGHYLIVVRWGEWSIEKDE